MGDFVQNHDHRLLPAPVWRCVCDDCNLKRDNQALHHGAMVVALRVIAKKWPFSDAGTLARTTLNAWNEQYDRDGNPMRKKPA